MDTSSNVGICPESTDNFLRHVLHNKHSNLLSGTSEIPTFSAMYCTLSHLPY